MRPRVSAPNASRPICTIVFLKRHIFYTITNGCRHVMDYWHVLDVSDLRFVFKWPTARTAVRVITGLFVWHYVTIDGFLFYNFSFYNRPTPRCRSVFVSKDTTLRPGVLFPRRLFEIIYEIRCNHIYTLARAHTYPKIVFTRTLRLVPQAI